MPAVVCTNCQVRLKVPDTMAGRKAKCPKCQAVIVVPAAEADAAFTPARPASPPPPPRTATRKAPPPEAIEDAPAGRSRSGRTMKEVLGDVEEPRSRRRQEEDEDRPRRRREEEDEDRPRRRRDADAEFAEDRPRRRKRSATSGSPLLLCGLIGGGGLLLLLTTTLFAWWLLGSGGGSADPRYFPDNPKFVVGIRPNEIVNSGTFKEIQKDFAAIQAMDLQVQKAIGISLQDLEQVTFAGDKEDGVGLARLTKNMTDQDLLARIPQREEFKPQKVANWTLQVNEPHAFCNLDGRQVLLGKTQTLKKVLERNRAATIPAGLQKAMSEVNLGASLAMAFDVKGLNQDNNQMANVPMPGADKLEAAAVEMRITDTVGVKVVAVFQDDGSARAIKDQAEGGLLMIRNQPGIPPEMAAILNSTQIAQSGTRVTGTSSFALAPLLKKAQGNFPGDMMVRDLERQIKQMMGGAGGAPTKDPLPVSKNVGSWTETIQPQQTHTYNFFGAVNNQYEVRVSGGTMLEVAVQDPNGLRLGSATKMNFANVSWQSPAARLYTIKVKNLGAAISRCSVQLVNTPAQGNNPPPVNPGLPAKDPAPVQKNLGTWPQSIQPQQTISYTVVGIPGREYELTVVSTFNTDVDAFVLDGNNNRVTADIGLSKDARVIWKCDRPQNYTLQVKNIDPALANQCTVTFREVVSGGPINPVPGGATRWVKTLTPGKAYSKMMEFQGGKQATVRVSSTWLGARAPDVDVFIEDPTNNNQLAADTSVGPNSFVTFTPPRTGFYRVRVANVGLGGIATATVEVTR